ncbi:MAG: hypothetical protein K1X89_19205 [Myxococcaceae bacterium]|nr:hypothetical protein [Myxococcaceae bacterium]
MASYFSLQLHPVTPSSRRLVKAFESEVRSLVDNGTQNRDLSIRAGADRLAGVVVRDGRVSDAELELLTKIKAQLQPATSSAPGAVAERQAATNLYAALEVDVDARTIDASSADLAAVELPQRALLPGSRRLLKSLDAAAERIGLGHGTVASEAKRVLEELGGDGPSHRQRALAAEVATSAHQLAGYLKNSRSDQPYHVWEDKYAVMAQLARAVATAANDA